MELHAENWKRVEVWWWGESYVGWVLVSKQLQNPSPLTEFKREHRRVWIGLFGTWNLYYLSSQSYSLPICPSCTFSHGQVSLELTLPLYFRTGSSGSWDADTGMSYSWTVQPSWPHVISTEQAWDSRSWMFTCDLPSLNHNSLSRCSICLNVKVMQKEIAARGHQMRTKIEWELDKAKDNVSSSGFCLLPVG